MIISASRRTDIPAFYSEWFMERIKAGFVDVLNPFNRKQVSRVSLSPEDVDCLVFWTKDAAPMLPYLDQLAAYAYYFQFTVTSYQQDVEPGLRPKREIIRTFQELSRRIGRERVVWRYDPILLNDRYTVAYHLRWFEQFLGELAPYTDCCVISFLDLYRKTERNTRPLQLHEMTPEKMVELAEGISWLARNSGVTIQSCSEELDLDAYGIQHGACIDKARIETVLGGTVDIRKDPTQRQVCGCMKSVDIGQYNTCRHLCRYCYANFNGDMARACYDQHDVNASILTGRLQGDEVITRRKVEHLHPQVPAEELTLPGMDLL